MSITTTSGLNPRALWTASLPSPASAMTSMSRSASIRSFSPCRTVTWSSARRMRSGCVLSATTHDRTGALGHGDAHENRRALSGRGFDLQATADERRALLHADEPESATSRLTIGVEANPVVLHDQEDGVMAPLEEYVDRACARVLGGVVERFLRDSIQRRLDVGREPFIDSRGVQARGNADTSGPVLGVIGQRGPEAEVVECRRAELPCEPIHVVIEATGNHVEGIDLAHEVRVARAPGLQRADAQAQRRQVLPEVVVHVPRDAPAFVLLREHEACQQLGADALG